MSEHCPLITCQLVDQYGNLISPYAPGAIVYTSLLNSYVNRWTVAPKGYIAVYSGKERISPPIPFCITTSFCLSVPKSSSVTFQLESFHAWAVTCQHKCTPGIGQIKLLISIETSVFSRKTTRLMIPQVDSNRNIIDRICIHANQICDSTRVHSECCICYKNSVLQAEISQYNTIADGIKRTFRNSDELKKYGNYGILSPEEVSYFNVFVNGLLQPQKNYILKKGEITFITQDIPTKGQTVIIQFVTWRNFECKIMNAIEWQYSTISNGFKKIYVNEDALSEYKNYGIPSPSEVSFFNLYINGVLQPKANYCVSKGVLELTTKDAPTKGAFVILESVIIQNSKRQPFRIKTSAYNAYSNGGKIYTNHNKIQMYGTDEILNPNESSYQNLFVNGIIQPQINYLVRRGYLIFETENSPTTKAPITLQSVNSIPAVPCCKTHLSDAALTQLKKVFLHIKNLDDLIQYSEGDNCFFS